MNKASKRSSCVACLRPVSTCICRWVTRLPHAVELLILQHPLEVANAKGSARLLHMSLPSSRLLVGEYFEPAALGALLAGKNNLLLYPDTVDAGALGLATPPALEPQWLAAPEQLRLVVLDGTWRKSRKMLYLNPLLQSLPRLALRDTPGSHYLIRKAHRADQLSTLEASCYALMQLDGTAPAQPAAAHRLTALIDAFDGFVAQQLSYINPRGTGGVNGA